MKLFAVLLSVLLLAPVMAAPLTVVEQGKSEFSIYHDPAAPSTVKQAATELQRVVEKSTGVKLPITTAHASPMICLGVNAASTAAGVDKDLPEFGFRLVTKDKDLFILGVDTADGKEQWFADIRRGTYNGTMEFLERCVNARWLMPGDVGEDIPKADKLAVNDLNLTDAPGINYRWLLLFDPTSNSPEVSAWMTHNRTDLRPKGAGINWGHNFNSYPTPEMRKEHPEILAVNKAGQTVKMDPRHMSYCLSKPVLYDLFAQCINERFDKNPKLISESMSPDEGADFCMCPDCAKIAMTTIPDRWKDLGARAPQSTAAVLNYYNEVAKRVREKHPERKVGGFIYQAYMVPLEKPIQMEPNIIFGIAMNTNYGFKLYQPKRQAIIQQFFDEWGKYGVEMGYYNYDTWMRNWFGFPIPPGRPLLKQTFPMFKRNHVKYMQQVGMDGWGYAAVGNWMLAKLLWNPDADVDALYSDFLTRAYGREAGERIGKIYDLVDEKLAAYINSKPSPDHEIDYAAAKAIYGPIALEMERLYAEALTKTAEGSPQRKRLEMFGDNLTQAHFHLWKAKLITDEQAKQSPLFVDTDEFAAWIAAREKEKVPSIISVSQWVKLYRYGEMPVLRDGWRPK